MEHPVEPLTFIEAVVLSVEDDEIEVEVTHPATSEYTLWFPIKLVPRDCRSFGTPLTIALTEDKKALAFQKRIVPAFIGPPTREDWELDQWANS